MLVGLLVIPMRMRTRHRILHNLNNAVCPVGRAGTMGGFSWHRPIQKSTGGKERGRGGAEKEGSKERISQVRSTNLCA